MYRARIGSLALVLGLVAAPTLHAQHQPTEGVRFGLGGGLIIPEGDYSSGDKMGWHVLGLIQLPISGSPIHLRFDGLYGQTSHKNNVSGSTKLAGGTADLLYHLGPHNSAVRPYVLGGVGFFNVKVDAPGFSGSTSKVAFGFGEIGRAHV